MIAFHGSQAVKSKYLERVKKHRKADQIVHGQYWQDGKGCAVGCTIHSGQHNRYETELGIPKELAHLEDGLFEALPNDVSMTWPSRFLLAIPVGADLSMVVPQFLYWLLADEAEGVIRFAPDEQYPRVRAAIERVAALFVRWISGETVIQPEWIEARYAADVAAAAATYADAAYAAAYAAADAAAYAAYAAAYAANVAAYAAYAAYAEAAYADAYADAEAADATNVAAYAAYAATNVANVAAYAAYAADAAARRFSIREEARIAARIRQSEKLLKLLAAAPVLEAEVVSQ